MTAGIRRGRDRLTLPAYGTPYAADPANWAAGGRPVTADELALAAAAARRYRDLG